MNYPKFNYQTAMPTPWGKADSVRRKGVFLEVSTPSHGGVMIGKNIAKDHLTRAAQRLAMQSGSFLCYEEDCLAAIPYFECPEVFVSSFPSYDTAEKVRASAMRTIKRWNTDYFDLLESECRNYPDASAKAKSLLELYVSSFVDDHIKILAVGEAGAKVSAAVSKAMSDVFKTL